MNRQLQRLFQTDFISSDYDRYYFGLRYCGNRFLLSKLAEHNLKGQPVLDIGCGRLILASVLACNGADLVAADLPQVFENQAVKKRAGDNGIRLVGYKLAADQSLRLPFKDESFSMILMTEVIEHLNFSPVFLFNEIERVLKPGGYLILTTPNVHRLENKLKFCFNKTIYGSFERYLNEPPYNYHWREFDKKELSALLTLNHFRIEKTYFCNDILINKFNRDYYKDAIQKAKAHLIRWVYTVFFFLSCLKKQIIIFAVKS